MWFEREVCFNCTQLNATQQSFCFAVVSGAESTVGLNEVTENQ